jgi:hypothetical protein
MHFVPLNVTAAVLSCFSAAPVVKASRRRAYARREAAINYLSVHSLLLPAASSGAPSVRPIRLVGRGVVRAVLLVAAVAFPEMAAAQSSLTREAIVRYQSSSLYPQPGYTEASVSVRYMFMSCGGDLHIHYELDPESVRTGIVYNYEGRSLPISANRSRSISRVLFAATVRFSGGEGRFSDSGAIAYSGAGCFGQTKPIRSGDRVVRVPGRTKSEQEAWLNEIHISDLEQPPPLRNPEIESEIRAMLEKEERERDEAEKARAAADEALRDQARQRARADSAANQARQDEVRRRARADSVAEIARWERQITDNQEVRAERERITREQQARDRVERERLDREAREQEVREREARVRAEREAGERAEREREARERVEHERAEAEGDAILWGVCGFEISGGPGTTIHLVLLEPFAMRRNGNVGRKEKDYARTEHWLVRSHFIDAFQQEGGVRRIRSGYQEVQFLGGFTNGCRAYETRDDAQEWVTTIVNRRRNNTTVVNWTPPSSLSRVRQ